MLRNAKVKICKYKVIAVAFRSIPRVKNSAAKAPEHLKKLEAYSPYNLNIFQQVSTWV